MKILITGGAGFIGSHVARKLTDQGEEVVIYDNFDDFLYPSSLKEARIQHMFEKDKHPRVISGNILNHELLDTVFEEEKIDRVIHLAALANPGMSIEAAEEYTAVNVMGTLYVLQAAAKHDVGQIIFAGSSSVYNDDQTPFREDFYPLHPRSPYGASKAAAEEYLVVWHELYGIPMTTLRFFSVYGPWGRPDMAPYIFAKHVLSGEKLYVTRDRHRDFTYIDDIVNGVLLALEKRLDYEIINLGRGEPVDLVGMLHALEEAAGKKANVEMREAPPGEMRITYANIEKAKKLLGYEPKVSVQEGAAHLIEWLKTYEGAK